MDAEIHYLTKVNYQELLTSNPDIHRVHTISKDVQEITPTLLKLDFDFIVDLHKNLRSYQLRSALNKNTGSYSKANLAKWLIVNLKLDFLPKEHIVDRYFQAVRSLDVSYDGMGLDLYLPPNLPSHKIVDVPYLCLVIGGAHQTKRMPTDKLVKLCRYIDSPIVLIGGKEESSEGEKISSENSRVINLAGQLSLMESALIIKQSRVVIAHDTGMMHMAAALKKKIVSIWGNTIPKFGMYPLYPVNSNIPHTIFEVQGLSCRPCSKIGFSQCPKRHFRCMIDQDEKRIAASAMQLISNK